MGCVSGWMVDNRQLARLSAAGIWHRAIPSGGHSEFRVLCNSMTNDQRGHGRNELQGSQPSIIYTCVSYQVSAVELGKDCFGGWMVDRSRVGRLLVSHITQSLWWLDGKQLVGCWYPAIPPGGRLELCISMTSGAVGATSPSVRSIRYSIISTYYIWIHQCDNSSCPLDI